MGARGASVNAARGFAHVVLIFVALACGIEAARAQSPQMDKPVKIVAFGDSLTAGYMLAPSEAFPVVLGKALVARGYKVEMINAGVSGDTTSGARERVGWAVPPDADAVILEFGANDALRGLDPAAAKRNLDFLIQGFKTQKMEILLAGMVAPRSMGDRYTKTFDAMFPDLAAQYGLLLYPFFLDKTALQSQLSLQDGMHPNAKGVVAIVADILPKVEELIARVKAHRTAAVKG